MSVKGSHVFVRSPRPSHGQSTWTKRIQRSSWTKRTQRKEGSIEFKGETGNKGEKGDMGQAALPELKANPVSQYHLPLF